MAPSVRPQTHNQQITFCVAVTFGEFERTGQRRQPSTAHATTGLIELKRELTVTIGVGAAGQHIVTTDHARDRAGRETSLRSQL